jgi:uncharacterized OB-fold protein
MARVARRPVPQVTSLTAPWWEAATRKKLAVQFCQNCDTYLHPPEPICPHCHQSNLSLREVSGRGRVLSATTMSQPRVQGFEDYAPFTCIAVEMEEQVGLVVLTNFVGDEGPEPEPEVGTPVEVTFETIADGVALPQFRRAPGSP